MVFVRKRLSYDDALDVFSVHGLGGMWGAVATGLFATGTVANQRHGRLLRQRAQLGIQLLSVAAAVAIAVVGTVVCYLLTMLVTGGKVRASEEDAGRAGLDLSQHGEQLESNA